MVELGISETEAKIYTALLQKREMSASEIYELTSVPRTKVYEITHKMALRGMCIEKLMNRKRKYQAVEPKRALSNLINQYENELQEKKELANAICNFFCPLYEKIREEKNLKELCGYVEIIKDINSIHERYLSLVKNTKKELIGFVKPPFATEYRIDKLIEQETVEYEILKTGIVVRMLYEYPEPNKVDITIKHIGKCVRAGEKARVVKKLPIKMYVFDQRYVLMALDNAESAVPLLTMLVIEHPGFARASRILFDHLWQQADDYQVLKSLRKKGSERTFFQKKVVR